MIEPATENLLTRFWPYARNRLISPQPSRLMKHPFYSYLARSCATVAFAVLIGASPTPAFADETPQSLPLGRNWSSPALITRNNDWSGVPGFMGYRGTGLASAPGANPQTITANDNSGQPFVLANKNKPNTLRTGGVAEFDGISDPVIALKGSATASAPYVLLNLNTKGHQGVVVSYNLRDIDSSGADAIQPIAFQYRVGTNGNFVNLASAFVADASSGPNLATLVTPVNVTLPAECDDQPLVQVRWITANAIGDDEWIGIDDISVVADGPSAAPAGPEPKTIPVGKTAKPRTAK